MYGSIIFLQYLYILARSFRTHLRKYIIFINIKIKKIYFIDVDGLSYVCKMAKIHNQKNSVTPLISILN